MDSAACYICSICISRTTSAEYGQKYVCPCTAALAPPSTRLAALLWRLAHVSVTTMLSSCTQLNTFCSACYGVFINSIVYQKEFPINSQHEPLC